MTDLSHFNDWSTSLYDLHSANQETASMYFSDVSVQNADDIINSEAKRFNSKLELERVLPDSWVVETLGSFVDGKFEGDLAELDHHDIVVKPINGTQGDNVRFVEAGIMSQLVRDGQIPDRLNAVVTRYYRCHPYSEAIKPHSSNTIRMLTYVDESGKAHNVATVHKWATEHSGFIDNWSKGGVTTWVANGILMNTMEDFSPTETRPGKAPHREPGHPQRRSYHEHPETRVQIAGKVIPYWKEAEAMVLEASEMLAPGILYAGWDVMITKFGPIIIEVNPWPGVQLIQVHAPLLGNRRFRHFLQAQGVKGV